jgi:hypothetical protein
MIASLQQRFSQRNPLRAARAFPAPAQAVYCDKNKHGVASTTTRNSVPGGGTSRQATDQGYTCAG